MPMREIKGKTEFYFQLAVFGSLFDDKNIDSPVVLLVGVDRDAGQDEKWKSLMDCS